MKTFTLFLGIALLLGSAPPLTTAQTQCAPTAPDMEGPFYKPGAPMRERTGKGFVVSETDFPPPYFGRPSHIHVKVFAPGHRTLTTQLYPNAGQTEILFDLVVSKQ